MSDAEITLPLNIPALSAIRSQIDTLKLRVAVLEKTGGGGGGEIDPVFLETVQALNEQIGALQEQIGAFQGQLAALEQRQTEDVGNILETIEGAGGAHRRLEERVTAMETRIVELESRGNGDPEVPGDGGGNGEPKPDPGLPPDFFRPAAPEPPMTPLNITIPASMSQPEMVERLSRMEPMTTAWFEGPRTINALSVRPRDHCVYRVKADWGAVKLDGQERNIRAFYGPAKKVWIYGFEITRYGAGLSFDSKGIATNRGDTGGSQIGAIQPDDIQFGGKAEGWNIVLCKVNGNFCTGVKTCRGMRISHSEVNDNWGRCGVSGGSGEIKLHWSDFCRNNLGDFYLHHESGNKLTGGGRTFQNPAWPGPGDDEIIGCRFFENNGPGWWFDWDCHSSKVIRCVFWGNGSAPWIVECGKEILFDRCVMGDNCRLGDDPHVMSFNGGGGAFQNAGHNVMKRCLIYITSRAAFQITQQNRRGGSPQGGVYVGHFVAGFNETGGFEDGEKNVWIFGRADAGLDRMQVDDPICTQPDPDKTGLHCMVLWGSEQQCRMEPIGGNWPPESLYTRYDMGKKTRHWAWVPGRRDPLYNEVMVEKREVFVRGSGVWEPRSEIPRWERPPRSKQEEDQAYE